MRVRIITAVWLFVRMVCCCLLATALLPLLPVDLWWIRIGDFPRVQLVACYIVCLAVVSLFRGRRSIGCWAGLMVFAVCVQLFYIFPYLPIAPLEVEHAQTNVRETRLKILTANVLQRNRRSDRILSLIQDLDPDIVVLVEVNARWVKELSSIEARFPHRVLYPLENRYGIALYSKRRLRESSVRHIVSEQIPSIDAVLELPNGKEVRLFALHPNPPRPGEDTTKRDGELILAGREIAERQQTTIVLGDLNDVGWSRTTNLFQEVSGLLDPRKGRGIFPTFHADSFFWQYPLDHLFHTDDFRVADLRTLPSVGSDHLPLYVELSYEPSAALTQEAPDLDAGDSEDADDAVRNAADLMQEVDASDHR